MKIFISYSRKDAGDYAEILRDTLIESGHQVFTDVKNIEKGEVWSNTIEDNIKTCDIFIIILTFFSLKSHEVEKEVLLAQRENKKIIPCIYKEVKPKAIKWDLNKIQGLEFENSNDLIRKIGILQDNNKAIKEIDKKNKSIAFISMPIEKNLEDVYLKCIIPVLKKNKFIVKRIDSKDKFIGDPLEHFISYVKSSTLFIAEISDMNPNVCFEIGYASALKRLIIFIAKEGTKIPYYYTREKILIYKSMLELRKDLNEQIEEMIKNKII